MHDGKLRTQWYEVGFRDAWRMAPGSQTGAETWRPREVIPLTPTDDVLLVQPQCRMSY